MSCLAAKRSDVIHVQLLGRGDGSTGVDYTVNAAIGYPARHRSGRSRRSDQPCAARLGRRAAACMPRWPSSPPSTAATSPGSGARISLALEDVALATAGNLGLLTEPQVNGTQRQRLGNSIYGQYGQDFISRDGVSVHGCHVDRPALSRPGRRDGHRRRRCRRSPRRWAWTSAPKGDRYRYRDVLSGLVRHLVRRAHGRGDHRGIVGHHRAVRAVPHLRGGRGRPAR